MRLLSAVAVLALYGASLVSASTPADGSPPSDVQFDCLLASVDFSNNFRLVGDFQSNIFHYQCSCADMGAAASTVLSVSAMSDSASVEVSVNGVGLNTRAKGNALSTDGAVASSPKTQSDNIVLNANANTITIGVGSNDKPESCYYQYTISCANPGAFVVGDPQFVGLRGQSYQVHGVSGEVYNIVSDADLQYNSRFVFLNNGQCPTVDGKKQKGCWSHPGSYLGELGLKTRSGDKIRLVSGPARSGFKTVEVNGKVVKLGETVLLEDNMGSVSRNSTHLASVQVGNWDFAFENSDMFVNQRVRVLDARNLRSHGLLGQTWRETTYPNSVKYVQGQVDDYVIRDKSLFGDSFVFNQFN